MDVYVILYQNKVKRQPRGMILGHGRERSQDELYVWALKQKEVTQYLQKRRVVEKYKSLMNTTLTINYLSRR